DQEGGGEGVGDAGVPADRRGDQKEDHVCERKRRVEAEIRSARRPAETGETGSGGKRQREHRVDVDAQAARDARIVDRGAQPAAEAGAGEDELQREREQPADDDDEQSISTHTYAKNFEAAL